MPEHFTEVVTSQIERISGCKTSAAGTDVVAKAGHIYFAPGDRHLVLKRHGLAVTLHLDDGPAINYFRPSADMLFNSAAEAFGPRVIAIVLSGMGSDGCNGATQIASAGGVVVAQDRETSAVWGMPAAVVEAGIASSVLPIDCIAEYVGRLLNRADGAAA
jgi:two-component system chemotaxis response regulator CheB